MKSATPKVLHPIGGRALVGHAIRAARATGAEHVGGRRAARARPGRRPRAPRSTPTCVIADQDEVKGTGRAVECGLRRAARRACTGTVARHLRRRAAAHRRDAARAHRRPRRERQRRHVVTAHLADPTGYGRIVRDADGRVERIVEQKDATDGERAIPEINSGIYAFDAAVLRDALAQRRHRQRAGREVPHRRRAPSPGAGGRPVRAHVARRPLADRGRQRPGAARGPGPRAQPPDRRGRMRAGVDDRRPRHHVDRRRRHASARTPRCCPAPSCSAPRTIGADAVDRPRGDPHRHRGRRRRPGHPGRRRPAPSSAPAPPSAPTPTCGPAPGSARGGKIGGFVETKNADIGDGAKVPHLSYAGDVTIGEGANIGAGTIFANYDGVAKHHSTVGRALVRRLATRCVVSPVDVADGAYVAAGSAVTDDVEPGQIAVARGRQRNIDGWVARARRRHRDRRGRRGGGAPGIPRPSRPTTPEGTTSEQPPTAVGEHPQAAQEAADALLGPRATPGSRRRSPRSSAPSSSRRAPTTSPTARSTCASRSRCAARDAFVIQSHTSPINECIMEQLLMVDALKRASAKRITVVMPFYGYARQDKKHRGREPISARLMADMFKTAGADRLICVDLHTDQIQGFFDGPVDHLMAIPILGEYVAAQVRRPGPRGRLAGRRPDQGRRAVVQAPRRRAAGVHPQDPRHQPAQRDGRQPGRRPDVRDRVCVLVDDMIDTGGTITKAADALMADGAKAVVIAATHAILSDPAVERLRDCAAEEVIVTNTLPIAAGEGGRRHHRALDRPAHQRRDQGGLRGRLGHEPLRRPRLSPFGRPPRSAAAPRCAAGCRAPEPSIGSPTDATLRSTSPDPGPSVDPDSATLLLTSRAQCRMPGARLPAERRPFVRSAGGLAGAVGRDVGPGAAGAVAELARPVLAEVDEQVLAVVAGAHLEPVGLAGADDVDQGHAHLDRDPPGERRVVATWRARASRRRRAARAGGALGPPRAGVLAASTRPSSSRAPDLAQPRAQGAHGIHLGLRSWGGDRSTPSGPSRRAARRGRAGPRGPRRRAPGPVLASAAACIRVMSVSWVKIILTPDIEAGYRHGQQHTLLLTFRREARSTEEAHHGRGDAAPPGARPGRDARCPARPSAPPGRSPSRS